MQVIPLHIVCVFVCSLMYVIYTHTHTHTHTHSDGVGRTGTFICLHSQLERLKTESVVDFFQSVKSARIQRAGLVSDAVCHVTHSLYVELTVCVCVSPPPRPTMPSAMMWWPVTWTALKHMPTSKKWCETFARIFHQE